MLCPECGASVGPGYSHCPWCGHTLPRPTLERPPEGVLERPTPRRRALTPEEDAFVGPLFRFPPLTALILAINVLLFLGMELHGGSEDPLTLLIFGAKLQTPIYRGETFRLLTANFLHIGIWHLVVNSFTLVQLGMVCENIYGRLRFFILYLLTGMGGFLASTVFTETLSAGASASLFGLMGATLTFGWRHHDEIPRSFRRHFTWYLLPWVVVMIAFGLYYGGIDNFAHIGGLVSGVLLALVLDNQIFSGMRLRPPLPVLLVTLVLGAFTLRASHDAYVQGSHHLALIQLQEAGGDPAGKVEVLSRFIDEGRDSSLYYYLRAQANFQAGWLDAAEADYREALRLGQDTPVLKNELAWTLVSHPSPTPPQIDEAIRLARQAIAADRNGAFLNTLAWALYHKDDLDEAERQLLAIFREEGEGPERVIDHYILAMIEQRRGKTKAALEHLRKANTLSAELPDPLGENARFRQRVEALTGPMP